MDSRYKVAGTLLFIVCCLLYGCGRATVNDVSSVVRTDVKPINSRFPRLGNPTNMCWIGESLSSNSRFSIPGKSAVRVRCLVRGISETCPKITTVKDWNGSVPPTDMFKDCSGEDIHYLQWEVSDVFNRYLFSFNYIGTAYYCKLRDLLYFDVWWE